MINMHFNLDFVQQLCIFSRTDYNREKPWSIRTVAGLRWCKLYL